MAPMPLARERAYDQQCRADCDGVLHQRDIRIEDFGGY